MPILFYPELDNKVKCFTRETEACSSIFLRF